MNKKEFIAITGKSGEFSDEFKAIYNSPKLIWNFITEKVIPEAIAEHEASEWKKYPEEKPDNQHYLCCADDGRQFVLYHDPKHGFGLMRSGGKYLNIIAFRELPAPYQKGGER